jgi:hypothetical protein
MTQAKPTNIAASIRQKLLNVANQTGDDPNVIWTRYAIERLLYRLFEKAALNRKGCCLRKWTKQVKSARTGC